MLPASTNTSATPFMNSWAPPPSHFAESCSSTGGKMKVSIVAAVADSSMPASCAITGSISAWASPPFHIALASAVTLRNLASSALSSATKLAGAEVTSNTRMPSSSFSAPVSSTLPCSFMRRSAPPQPQTMSRLPWAKAAAPSGGAMSTISMVEMSTPKWSICLRKP